MEILSNDFETNVRELDSRLRVKENFDLIRREMAVGEGRLVFYYIDGFIKDGVMQRLMQYFIGLKETGNAEQFVTCHVPYVEVDRTGDIGQLMLSVYAGSAVVLGSSFGGQGVIIDARTYPARETGEPESDKVMQGAKDGFVEWLGKENLTKGVQVNITEAGIDIDLFIIVEYGISIVEVCNIIKSQVCYKIENMTGAKVRRVNISVEGIRV